MKRFCNKGVGRMFNFVRRPAPSRASVGAMMLALTAISGYGIGVAHSPHAALSAAPAPVSRFDIGAAPTSYARVVDAVAPAVVTVRVEKRATVRKTDAPDHDLF